MPLPLTTTCDDCGELICSRCSNHRDTACTCDDDDALSDDASGRASDSEED